MSADEKNAINMIVIVGGYNDADRLMNGDFTVNQLRTAVGDCIDYARATFPNAFIYLCCPAWRNNNFAVHAYIRAIENIYSNALMPRKLCAYIDGVYWLHRQALVDSTGFHPNAIGSEAIANSIASVLNGGTCFCDLAINANNGAITPTGTWTSNISALTFNNVKQYYKNGFGVMEWQQIAFTPTVNINANGEIAILDFTDGIFQGGVNFADAVSFPCIAQVGGNNIKANLLIHENKLFFGNGESTPIMANTPVNIIYGSGIGYVMI